MSFRYTYTHVAVHDYIYTIREGHGHETYSPKTILWKLPFCISPCSETPPANIILSSSASQKPLEVPQKFENRLSNKEMRPEIILTTCMTFFHCENVSNLSRNLFSNISF